MIRHEQFPSSHIAPRHVDVWLPPSYETAPNRRFPVLYMHDGQNLFRPEESFLGIDWGVVPALEKLIANQQAPETILVGIWNTPQRYQEYLPQKPFDTAVGTRAKAKLDPRFAGKILSDAYLRFLVTELKPFIDTQYRTLPDPPHTSLMGSSMGGLISLYGLCEYPAVFGGAGCLSTHWPAVDEVILPYLQAALPAPGQHRLYFDYGTETLDALYEPHQVQVDEVLRAKGYTAVDWQTRRFEGAEHNEAAWRERVHLPLAFLLGSQPHQPQ